MKLGKMQKEILVALKQNEDKWFPGCGWGLGTPQQTAKVLDTLVTKHLVDYFKPGTKHPWLKDFKSGYRLNIHGKNLLFQLGA